LSTGALAFSDHTKARLVLMCGSMLDSLLAAPMIENFDLPLDL
jgi:hypothetical protein